MGRYRVTVEDALVIRRYFFVEIDNARDEDDASEKALALAISGKVEADDEEQIDNEPYEVTEIESFAHTPPRCPSKHWNRGDDICADCGEWLA